MTHEAAQNADTRVERLGATGDQDGLYVRFDYGFGTNVHIGIRHWRGYCHQPHQDQELAVLGIKGWERLCELVDEWRALDNDGGRGGDDVGT